MAGSDGLPSIAHIEVTGDPKSCPVPKLPGGGKPPVTPATAANIQLAPAAGGGPRAEVCAASWRLVISGDGAPDITSAKIEKVGQGGKDGQPVKPVLLKGGKTVSLTFPALTELPGKGAAADLPIDLTSSENVTFTEKITATCVPPVVAKPAEPGKQQQQQRQAPAQQPQAPAQQPQTPAQQPPPAQVHSPKPAATNQQGPTVAPATPQTPPASGATQ